MTGAIEKRQQRPIRYLVPGTDVCIPFPFSFQTYPSTVAIVENSITSSHKQSKPTPPPFQKPCSPPTEQIRLVVRLGLPMLPAALEHGLVLARIAVVELLEVHGPGTLPPLSDPYVVNSEFNVEVKMNSNLPAGRHLNYAIMRYTMVGLFHLLVTQGYRHYRQCTFNIYRGGIRWGGGV